MMLVQSASSVIRNFFRALGPALIVASVVLGPGSILSSSKVGASYGYRMVWVPVLAAALMTGMVAMGARLGVVLEGTMCDELAARLGRPFAALIGLTIFLVCAGFQFGNNLAVLAVIDTFVDADLAAENSEARLLANSLLVLLNVICVGFLLVFRHLYKPIELMMKILVGLMILAFLGNFVFLLIKGAPPVSQPAVEAQSAGIAEQVATQNFIAVLGLIGTTFSVAGAFYQAYLVREKGWTATDLKKGLVDSVVSIGVLGSITLVIMLTAALSFHGREVELKSSADVAQQLKPLFGSAAVILFGLGLFAAAFSSFLVNAMIGGAMLSDGIGLGGLMDGRATKAFTVLALAIGLLVAILVSPDDRVGVIVFAQAMVVVGFPLLAFSMLYLATRPDLTGERRIPMWMKAVALVGVTVVLLSALRVAQAVWDKIAAWLTG